MGDPLTAHERLRRLSRDKRRARRERLVREAAGPVWRAVQRVIPTVFTLAGALHVRRLVASRADVEEALRLSGVLALDAAMRAHAGSGLFANGDLHVYLADTGPLESLTADGLIASRAEPDEVLIRPWARAPRLFAVVTPNLPPHEHRPDGARIVTRDHLIREVLGAAGLRFDLLAPLVTGPHSTAKRAPDATGE